MNRIGYVLLRGKKVDDAIEVFTQNVADHPESWNVHDSLGEAYAAGGKTDLAIKAYERSLELNPANTGGAEALKKLRAVSR
jgi:predicted negative regulator of RcsB-dependent stress response